MKNVTRKEKIISTPETEKLEENNRIVKNGNQDVVRSQSQPQASNTSYQSPETSTVPIIKREVEGSDEESIADEESIKENIRSFNSFVFEVLTKSTISGDMIYPGALAYKNEQARRTEETKEKFKEFFGISYGTLTKLLTEKISFEDFLNDEKYEEDCKNFIDAMKQIGENAGTILSKTDQYSKGRVIRFLGALEAFLSSKAEKIGNCGETLKSILDFEANTQLLYGQLNALSKDYNSKFPPKKNEKQILSDFSDSEEENEELQIPSGARLSYALEKEEIKASQPVKVLSEEEKLAIDFKECILFIADNLGYFGSDAHFELIDKHINFLLSLDTNKLDEARKNMVEQTKQCILEAGKHHVNSRNPVQLALGLKLLKKLDADLYKRTLECKYPLLLNKDTYTIYSTDDVFILNDISCIKSNTLSKVECINVECKTSVYYLRNDQQVSEALFKVLSTNLDCQNIKNIKFIGEHVGDLGIPSLHTIEAIEIHDVKGSLTVSPCLSLKLILVSGRIENQLAIQVQPKLEALNIYEYSGGLQIFPTMPELSVLVISGPHGEISIKSQPKLTQIKLGDIRGEKVKLVLEQPQPKNQRIIYPKDKVEIVRVEAPVEVEEPVKLEERVKVELPKSKVLELPKIGVVFGLAAVWTFIKAWIDSDPLFFAMGVGLIGALFVSKKLSERKVAHINQ